MRNQHFARRWRAPASLVALLGLIAGTMLVGVAPASATAISPVGLTQLKFQAGSFLDINFGLPTAQHFDLGPSTSIGCSDGVENNDAAPLGTVGSGGGTDTLFDYYPLDNSRSIVAGTATGGSATSVVDTSATWTTNQWQGKSVWITAGPGAGGAAHIVSNTATTLTLNATNNNAPVGYIQGLATAGAGSVYNISTADPECSSATDDSELANGFQAKENVVIVATIAADGTTSIPKTVRTSEASALSSGGIYFPPGYIPDATQGMIVAGIQPAPTGAPATPFAGTINIDSGAVAMPLNIRVQLQGGTGLTALGTSCYVPSNSDSNGIVLPLSSGTTSPVAPNFPITGKPFNRHNSKFTVVANNFAVGGAGNNCALLNFGASSINDAFGLPAAAGNNTASFTLQTSPALNYTGPADAGPDQFAHNAALVTLDGSDSYDVAGDPIATYEWTQTSGPPVVLTGADGPHPTFTTDATDATYTFDLTVTTTGASSSTDSVTVTSSGNVAPVANAGPDQTGKVAGTTVALEGSASDANNDPLTYSWTQTAGPPVTLADPTTRRPSFVVPAVTTPAGDAFTFALTADDGFPGGTGTDSVTVTSAASTPTVTVAKARSGGTCTNFCTGDLLTLSAGITNPDGTNPADYTYVWTQVSGRTTALSSTTAANPTYTLPSSGAAPTTTACTSGTTATSPTSANCPRFQVVVTKTNTNKASAATALAAYASTLPTRPVANAGTGQQVLVGDPVTLNGTASTQAQAHSISYAWAQTAGTPVTLSNSTAASPTFTSPLTPQTLTFSLTVVDTQSPITGTGTNGNTSLASTVNVVVQPNAVVASAGPDQTGKVAGSVVQLDASGSFEPHALPLSYTWTQTAGPAVTLSNPGIVNPTFTVPAVTSPTGQTMTFQVTATNGGPNPADTGTDTVDVTSTPSTPTATVSRAPSGTVVTGDPVTLTANITNPDGTNPADYTYLWSQVSGRTTALSSTTAANPTFTVPSSGGAPTTTACTSGTGTTSATSANCPRFQVVVTKINTGKASAAAALAAYASSLPTRPVANAGTAQSVKVGSGTVTLDGSGSTQAQGHVISYAWSQTAGPAVTLSSTTAQKPTFTAPNTAASYTFSLTVTDTQSPITSGASINTSLASTVTVSVTNYASPIASSGTNQSVLVGSGTVTLDASGSSQADGHLLTYSWTQTAGTPVVLSSATAVQPTFTAPNAGTTLKFTVTVTDAQNPNPAAASTTSPEVTIGVGDFGSPVADPGPDQTVHRRDVVTLDSSGSSQADGHPLAYQWTQTAGTPVALSDATAQKPTFTAPETPGSLKFTVTVSDTANPNPATASTTSTAVQIDVQDYAAPIADAGPNQSNIDIGTTVTLDGSASAQIDGHGLTYSWTQVSGPAVTLSSSTAQKPTFTAPTGPVTLGFELTVDDTFNTSAPATVFVNVNGIAGLDFATQITGDVRGEKASSPFTVTVVNNGVLTRSITSAGLAVSITRNNVAVPSSEYSVAAKTVSLAAHKQANFVLTWNHGTTALHLGDDITVSVCENQLGDSVPGNNCGVKTDPPGPEAIFAWPKTGWTIKSTQTSNNLAVWITNMSSFTARPIRVSENMTVTVKVNGGPDQNVAAPTMAPFALGPNLGTNDAVFVWAHPKLTKGDSVDVKACAVNVPGNTAVPNCWTRTIIVS